MCSIAGAVDLKMRDDTIRQMCQTMHRRGPDDLTNIRLDNCTLLHSRLAIIDPEHGRQPMTLQWEGENYTIVYNGELYNTHEIKSELLRQNHIFTNQSDTEVVLHAYAQWKAAALLKLNGIFAFAIWEHRTGQLFLARDRLGVKPLFYKRHRGGFLFASEIKTILAYPGVPATITAEGAAEILLLGPGRMPGSGVFRDIYELEPGCCGYYQNGSWKWDRYWKLYDREHGDSFEETAEKVRFLVLDSIKRQMVSDVPLGTFLSGGLDSSIISAVCAKEYAAQGKRLDTFSVDYRDNQKYFVPGKFQPDSDNHYIQIMEKAIESNHHWTVLSSEELLDSLDEAVCARDLPGMADVDSSMLAFCKTIRSHVKVALSGECADEIFGGYPWYRDPETRMCNGFPWAQNTKQRASFLSEEIASRIDAAEFVNACYQRTIDESDILPKQSPQERRMKEMVNLNFRWFMQTLLDRKDRMSMYSGLEVRVPFCDYRIAEYLYGVPWEYKDHKGREKGLLRYAMQGILPDEILLRKKSPYPKTFDPRYFSAVCDRLQAVIADPQAPILQIVKRKAIEDLMNAEYVWPWYGQLMKVPQTVAYMLQINYWMTKYKVEVIA